VYSRRSGGDRERAWPGLANLHVTIEVKRTDARLTHVLFIACHIDFPSTSRAHTSGREGSQCTCVSLCWERVQRAEVCTPVPGKAAHRAPLNSQAHHLSVSSSKVHTAISCPQHIATCSQFCISDTMLCLLYIYEHCSWPAADFHALSTNVHLAIQ